jgi:hypothetical protein
MKTQAIKVKLRDGEMGAYLAIPDRTPAGAITAIMEIWGVNDTMRRHAHEFAQAGFVCLVPDLFWRQEPGVELSDHDPEHVKKAFDLYYDFDYDLAVRDMEETWHFLQRLPECNGKVGAVGMFLEQRYQQLSQDLMMMLLKAPALSALQRDTSILQRIAQLLWIAHEMNQLARYADSICAHIVFIVRGKS